MQTCGINMDHALQLRPSAKHNARVGADHVVIASYCSTQLSDDDSNCMNQCVMA